MDSMDDDVGDDDDNNKRLSYRREIRATLCVSWNVVLLLYE